MADKRISELTAATSLADADLIPIVQGGETKRLSGSAVKAYVASTDQPSVISVNSSSDALRITQTGAGNALVVEDSANPDSTPFVVDANGKVIVGNPLPITSLGVVPTSQVIGTGLSSSTYLAACFANDATSAGSIYLNKSRGAIGTIGTIVQSGDRLGSVQFLGDDGAALIRGATIFAEVDGTPGTNDMPGRLVFSTTADGASSPTERMRIDSRGNVGIGATGTPEVKLTLGGTWPSSGGYSIAYSASGIIPSTTTTEHTSYNSAVYAQSTAFTLGRIKHFNAQQPNAFSGGLTVTNQYGFFANSNLTGATNNYGFYSDIASGTGRYNFYAGGTADNYLAGSLGIGTTSLTGINLYVAKQITGSSSSYGIAVSSTVQPDVSYAAIFNSNIATSAAAFSLSSLYHFAASQSTIGSGSTVTNQYGFFANSTLTGATNNYGFYSNIASGTGRYNFYAAGTAANYFAGTVGIGIAPTAGYTLDIQKNLTGAAFSYGVYSGGTVQSDVTDTGGSFISAITTQATSFTLPSIRHFWANPPASFGAGSTVTNQFGFAVSSTLTGATNNFGFYSNIASGTGRWNFYAAGTADNYFAGPVVVSTSSSSDALRITQTGAGNALVVEDSANPDSTPFVVNSVGQSIIGATQNYNIVGGRTPLLSLHGYDYAYGAFGVNRWSADNQGFYVGLNKSRGTTAGTHTVVLNNDGLGVVEFSGSDGTSFIPAASIYASVDGTPGTNDMPGRLVFSTTADGASSPTERMRIDNAGRVGIGGSPTGGSSLRVIKPITGSTFSYGFLSDGTVQSDVTSGGVYFRSTTSTQAASFTLSNLYNFAAAQGTIGAGSTVTNQYGYYTDASLTGATNNFGFYSNIASGTGRYNFYAAGTADNYFAGAVGIGAAVAAGQGLLVNKSITGATASYQITSRGAVQSDVTSTASYYRAVSSTQATAFTAPEITHFLAEQGTFGAGSTVTNQLGFYAASSLTGATNNYGFYSGIASGTGRYNFYAAGTADNYFAGAVFVGGILGGDTKFAIGGTLPSGGSSSFANRVVVTAPSASTSVAVGFDTSISTTAASYTLDTLIHHNASQGTIGAGSTVTSQRGFSAQATLTGATNNYGFYSNIASGTGRYNFYAAGTADNYFAGNVGIGALPTTRLTIGQPGAGTSIAAYYNGSTGGGAEIKVSNGFSSTSPIYAFWYNNNTGIGNPASETVSVIISSTERLRIDSSGNVLVTGSGGLGYGTGSGGAVTQATSRTTGVTLNKTNGAITLVSAAGSATYQTFTVTNSTVAATDVIHVSQKSGTDKYIILVTAVAAGSFAITFATTGGTTTEQPVFNFAVLKAVAA